MRLKILEVCNFRAFYGHQSLVFSNDEDKPVTVIHGENGAGKTNLLNALYWCLTGEFTPRLNNPKLLLNKAAHAEDSYAECFVEVLFEYESIDYRARRSFSNGATTKFSIFKIEKGASSTVPNPQVFIERVIPKGLSKWFFFDAEAVGELSLSGGIEFKRSIRRTLGFELVDKLAQDLDVCLNKKQKNLNNLVNSKDLNIIQKKIDDLLHVLPDQKDGLEKTQAELKGVMHDLEEINDQLKNLPQSKPLQERRSRLEQQRKTRSEQRIQLKREIAKFNGESIPGVLVFEKAHAFEDKLKIKENAGKLPAPYSDQLVSEILESHTCICGRPVIAGSEHEGKINGLLKFASTGSFNSKIKGIQYLLQDIKGFKHKYVETITALRQQLNVIETELAELDEEINDIQKQLEGFPEEKVNSLEKDRSIAMLKMSKLSSNQGMQSSRISEIEANLKDFKLRYENESKKLGLGDQVKIELEKIRKLQKYIVFTLKQQEDRALQVLQIELNNVLAKYLTKHYQATIDSKDYQIKMLDSNGREVGESTGEGHVLKFAFISTIVALAGRKTLEKIDFMAEPTIAPLVLDAPFSVLDPAYQGSVAKNLADQTNQLVLLLSSAAWPSVENSLNDFVGKRYVLISKQSGSQGQKPIKEMKIGKRRLLLNEYDADRDESVIEEI